MLLLLAAGIDRYSLVLRELNLEQFRFGGLIDDSQCDISEIMHCYQQWIDG